MMGPCFPPVQEFPRAEELAATEALIRVYCSDEEAFGLREGVVYALNDLEKPKTGGGPEICMLELTASRRTVWKDVRSHAPR